MADNEHHPNHADYEHLAGELWDKVVANTGITPQRKTINWWPRIAVAASVAVGLLAGGYFLQDEKQAPQQPVAQNKIVKSEILPGGNKAVLTLANGKQIDLNDARQGQLAHYDNTQINKTAEGQIVYNGGNVKTAAVTYNTIATPRGGQYSLTLTDGTKVTLNASSSLKFPICFTGNERLVELTGEAYFEVAHNAAKPFKVINGGQTIEVLGTHFNINSYDDNDLVKTTLLEGSVKIVAAGQKVVLAPGQQSQINFNDAKADIKVITANMEEAVAWKNGLFEFNRASIQDVMRSAARWYDLKVIYSETPSNIKISGRISRKVNFSGLIDLLEFEGVKFTIDGRNVKILN